MSVLYFFKTDINGVLIFSVNATLWRPLWPELMTYRRASRNASSNRVLRFGSQPTFTKPILTKPAKGMAVAERVDLEAERDFLADVETLYQHTLAVMQKYINTVSRSILNRYLEPFTMINFVFTTDSVSWEHIFTQRVYGENVEPNFRVFCQEVLDIYNRAQAVLAQWHLPFFDDFKINNTDDLVRAIKISAARCARTSYTPFGSQVRSLAEDFELAEKLIALGHLTPFEHQLISTGLVPKGTKKHPFIEGNVVSARQLLETFGKIVLR